MTEVVAALIFKDSKFLVCQRPPHKARGLLWEFVGGKVEGGETKEQALIRECMEELGVTVAIEGEFMAVTHKYPDITVHLTVFTARICEGEPLLLEHAAIKWITPEEIKNYDFCPADRDILKKITKEYFPDGKKKKKLGGKGEKMAAKHLKKLGYKILERNLRTPFGEVDIVAKCKDVLVFCEVKTRFSDDFGAPSEAVTERRQQRYIRAAEHYAKGLDCTVRFDVIEIYRGEINHIINAFTA